MVQFLLHLHRPVCNLDLLFTLLFFVLGGDVRKKAFFRLLRLLADFLFRTVFALISLHFNLLFGKDVCLENEVVGIPLEIVELSVLPQVIEVNLIRVER